MENNKLFRAVERSTQDIPITIDRGNSKRWTIQSQKTKYVNGKMSGVIGVGYTANHLNSDMLSWSCLDKAGNAFNPSYSLPDNSYFTTKTTGLGSYTLTKVSTPPSSSQSTIVLSSRFNPTKKYPLDLNFYWV